MELLKVTLMRRLLIVLMPGNPILWAPDIKEFVPEDCFIILEGLIIWMKCMILISMPKRNI